MRGTNRMRSLLISGAVVLLALSIVVGMTWALFTDTETLNHHLKAGDLDITLTRTRLTTRYLDNADGYLKDYSDGSPKDFTNTTANVFDIANGAIVVPGSTYVAEMEITNESDVAFMYWVEVVYKIVGADGTVIENPTTDINLELGKQIELKVISAKGETSTPLNKGLVVGSEESPIGILQKKADGKKYSDKFTVSIEFVDDYVRSEFDNDKAKGRNVKFDLVIHAVQVQKDPNATTTTS